MGLEEFCLLFLLGGMVGGMLFFSVLYDWVVLFASDPGTCSGVRLHRVFQLNMIDTPFFNISKYEAKEAVYIFSRFSVSNESKMWARPDGWCDLPDKGSRDLNKVRKLNISRLIMILISVNPFKQLQLICSGLYRATSKDTAFVRVHSQRANKRCECLSVFPIFKLNWDGYGRWWSSQAMVKIVLYLFLLNFGF